MYIWRQKNKRDEHFPKSFAYAGVKNDTFDLGSDDQVRIDLEEEHIDYFHEHVSTVLKKYLKTERGLIEVNCIRKELGKVRLNDPEYAKKIKGTVPKKPSELAKEKAAAEAAIQEGVVDDKTKQKKKKGPGIVARAKDLFSTKTPLAILHPELLVEEAEARDMILESTVRKYERDALAEFRRAVPPDFSCHICRESFNTAGELDKHERDDEVKDYHLVLKDLEAQAELRTKYVDQMFTGPQGRSLKANRIMYSSALAPLDLRLNGVCEAPMRPFLADQRGRRAKQQAMGLNVRGFNPVDGVRSKHREYGLTTQHNAPRYTSGGLAAEVLPLQDVLLSLEHLKNENSGHDKVVCPEVSQHVGVKFMWKEQALNAVMVIGDFNGWKPQPLLLTDPQLGRNYHVVPLTVGRYKYRYVVDGLQRVDNTSTIVEADGELYNLIEVCNPAAITEYGMGAVQPTQFGEQLRSIDLSNVQLLDDGAWTLASHLHHAKVMESIDLSRNGISDDGMHALSVALRRLPNLHTLKLNDNGFGVDGCTYMVNALRHTKSVKHLEICRNRLCMDGAEVLATLIKFSSHLEVLYADDNLLGDEVGPSRRQPLSFTHPSLINTTQPSLTSSHPIPPHSTPHLPHLPPRLTPTGHGVHRRRPRLLPHAVPALPLPQQHLGEGLRRPVPLARAQHGSQGPAPAAQPARSRGGQARGRADGAQQVPHLARHLGRAADAARVQPGHAGDQLRGDEEQTPAAPQAAVQRPGGPASGAAGLRPAGQQGPGRHRPVLQHPPGPLVQGPQRPQEAARAREAHRRGRGEDHLREDATDGADHQRAEEVRAAADGREG